MGETAAPGFVYVHGLGTLVKVSVLSMSISQVPFGRCDQATGTFQEGLGTSWLLCLIHFFLKHIPHLKGCH